MILKGNRNLAVYSMFLFSFSPIILLLFWTEYSFHTQKLMSVRMKVVRSVFRIYSVCGSIEMQLVRSTSFLINVYCGIGNAFKIKFIAILDFQVFSPLSVTQCKRLIDNDGCLPYQLSCIELLTWFSRHVFFCLYVIFVALQLEL